MNLFSISLILSGPAQSAIALTIFRTSGSLIEYPRKITGYSPKMVNILAMRYLAFSLNYYLLRNIELVIYTKQEAG